MAITEKKEVIFEIPQDILDRFSEMCAAVKAASAPFMESGSLPIAYDFLLDIKGAEEALDRCMQKVRSKHPNTDIAGHIGVKDRRMVFRLEYWERRAAA